MLQRLRPKRYNVREEFFVIFFYFVHFSDKISNNALYVGEFMDFSFVAKIIFRIFVPDFESL